MAKHVLAFDFGASSGRAMLGSFDGERIALSEVHRFENNPVTVRGTFYWDVLRLFYDIRLGLSRARQEAEFSSVGIDTWGVDFGLLDKKGALLQNPVHYRDGRTGGTERELDRLVGKDVIYGETGIQFMEINTINHLYALAKEDPELMSRVDCALLMPDLFGYFLTGNKTAEYSMASTTQLMNPHTRQWNRDTMEKLGIPGGLFPDIVPSGTPLGPVDRDIREELGLGGVNVISVAGHDTGSAVVAVPALEEDFIYISCGTWSLFGTELPQPLINEKSRRYNITNEGGYGYTTRFLKNIIGLWLIQETRRQYRREGKEYGYNDLERFALKAEPFRYFIDPDAPEFVPPGNQPERVRAYCKRTGQGEPETVGEIMRCIYESIAMKYRLTYDLIKECTGRTYRHIHMIGGGTKDNLLCQMTADATGLPILAGPIEATAMGNVAVQLMAQGEIAGLQEARQVITRSVRPVLYQPKDYGSWQDAYGRFSQIMGKETVAV